MNKDDPSYLERFIELVRASDDELKDVPDERLRAAVEAALAEHPEDAWRDEFFVRVGQVFFAAVRRALGLQ